MSIVRDAISLLVYEPYGWVQTVSFYLLGVSILAAAIILQIKLTVRFNLGAIVLAVMGLAFFVIGSCRTPLPGGPVTLSAGLHTYATAVVVLTFPLARFLIAPTLWAWGYRRLHLYTIMAGAFQLLFACLGGYFLVMQYGLMGHL